MKIVLTGSLGNIGKPLTEELVKKGHAVTVISSNAARQKEIEATGATAAIGLMEDEDFLTAAFTGADVVYTMVGRPSFFEPGFDPVAYSRNVVTNYAAAIRKAGIKRVVHLSSIGAHAEKDSGLILLHRAAEDILNKLTDVDITFMRPAGFYYNLLAFIPMIKSTGRMSSNYGANDMIPWVSPTDIAAAVAEEITASPSGRKIRYVASEELSCNEVSAILGAAIGIPDLKWDLISGEELKANFKAAGMPETIAAALVEMQESMHNGELYKDYYLNRPALGKVKMSDYAREFAAAYKQ